MQDKPFAESCEQNKQVILDILQLELTDSRRVLEIGSGTGQHAVYFAQYLPHLSWQCTDVADNLPGIRAWLNDAGLDNTPPPLALDVRENDWPMQTYDAVFSANAIHIMSWQAVESMFAGIGRVLKTGGRVCLYGPFNYGGMFTSDSNARFDAWLKGRDPLSGIRHFEDLDALAEQAGMVLANDYAMPANNRILVWGKH
jgi:cyclopropane fatty-acyl-phospholipid synthase-like methyltransferase